MFYTIYKITNKINAKIYIGKHQTNDLNDGYMGSGKYIKRAIAKYGIENFQKEILFILNSEEEMNNKEKELVTKEFVDESTNYNLCQGGKGGFGYINSNGLLTHEIRKKASINRWKNSEYREKIIPILLKTLHSEESKRKSLDTIKSKYPNGIFYNKTHNSESKRKIGEQNSKHQIGENNSQYGTKWITNGKERKKIDQNDDIPYGWQHGASLISIPIIIDYLEICDYCKEKEDTIYWYDQLVNSGLSLRNFVKDYNYPYSYQTLVTKCRRHIPEFITKIGKKFNSPY